MLGFLGAHRHLRDLDWSARLSALERQGIAVVSGVAVGGVARWWSPLPPEVVFLLAWLAYCVVELSLAWRLAARLDASGTQRRARSLDPGAAWLFVLVAAAACASVVAVASAVHTSGQLQGWARGLQIALAMAALAASWLLIQMLFALRYARDFYQPEASGDGPAGGLVFAGGCEPDYLDFLYVSATIGMTSQVSDVAVASRAMRRLTLAHSLLAFAFNLIVLALAVNTVAGSLSH